jgi:AraC family transcriptional regulator
VADAVEVFAPITLGTCLWRESIGDLELAETRARPGASLPRHAHEHACLVVALQGSFTEVFRTRSVVCDVATSLFKPAGEAHTNNYGRVGARCLVVEFRRSKMEDICQRTRPLDEVATVRSGAVMRLATHVHCELARQDATSPLVVEGLILELLGTTFRYSGSDTISRAPRWLERLRERLHAEFTSKLSIADLAADVDFHPDYVSRCFRQQYGMLIGEYVRRLRVEWAAHEIKTTRTPLVQIAQAAGFSDQAEFTRRFRELTGMTPGHYRATHAATYTPSHPEVPAPRAPW